MHRLKLDSGLRESVLVGYGTFTDTASVFRHSAGSALTVVAVVIRIRFLGNVSSSSNVPKQGSSLKYEHDSFDTILILRGKY